MALTWTAKKNIDFLTPAAMCCITGYVAFKKKATWQMMALLMVLVYILGYVFTSQITKAIFLAGPPLAAGADPSYDPAPLAKRLRDNMYCGFCQRDLSIYEDLLTSTDGQILSVYNFWKTNYYREHKETLPAALADEIAFLDAPFGQLKDALLKKFTQLQLQ